MPRHTVLGLCLSTREELDMIPVLNEPMKPNNLMGGVAELLNQSLSSVQGDVIVFERHTSTVYLQETGDTD